MISGSLFLVTVLVAIGDECRPQSLTARFEEATVELTGETADALAIDGDFIPRIESVVVDGQPGPQKVAGIRFRANVAAPCQSFRFVHSARDEADPKAAPTVVIKAEPEADRDCQPGLALQTTGGETFPRYPVRASLQIRFSQPSPPAGTAARTNSAGPGIAVLRDRPVRCISGRAVSIVGGGVPPVLSGVVRLLRVCDSRLQIQSLTPGTADPDGDLAAIVKAPGSFDLVDIDGERPAFLRRLRLVQDILHLGK
jgi:hypothetical protein